jgi:uncharacterized protein YndB with AHSA1/START domain
MNSLSRIIYLRRLNLNTEPVIKEVYLNAPASKVWKSITDKDEMKQWYFDLAEFIPEEGFEFRFYGGDENMQWLHLCRITEVIAEKKLTYSWRYDGYPGISYVTFELFPEGKRTLIKLIHTGLENFPSNIVPQLKKENFIDGWNHIIGKSLKEYVEKT